MKHSIGTRFTLGLVFLFLIIIVLSVFSGYYMNQLSKKTGAILKENFLSVVYAREMSEGIMSINHEIVGSFLLKKHSDTLKISNEFGLIDKSLLNAKNNVTEPGEDKLITEIESNYHEYRDAIRKLLRSTMENNTALTIENMSGSLYNQLLILSQMNGNALEAKTDDAKATSKSALTQMTILATLCFLIGISFTYSFGSYFSQRFYQLYNGINELVESNYDQRLFFEGDDEFHEISLLLNEMAAKLKQNKEKMSVTLPDGITNGSTDPAVDELKQMLLRIKKVEEQATFQINKFDKK